MPILEVFTHPSNFLWPIKVKKSGDLFYSSPILPWYGDGKDPIFSDLDSQMKQVFNKLDLAIAMANLSRENLTDIHIAIKFGFDTFSIEERVSDLCERYFQCLAESTNLNIYWTENLPVGILVRASFKAKISKEDSH